MACHYIFYPIQLIHLRHRVMVTEQLLSLSGVTHIWSPSLVTKHWFLLLYYYFFVGVMVYLPHICFNHTLECLATALFSLSCFSIFCPCMPFQQLGFEDRFQEDLMAGAAL